MLIVADENIPLLDSFFGDIGEIRRVSGRSMSNEDVRDADIVLVRSVTRVNRELLEGSRVRFVGTTTIGTDHVDLDWLEAAGIRFSAAPGCNANSVAEYVLSVLSLHAERRGLADWSQLSVGIVGVGNVGGELAHKLERLGFDVRLCDPPRADREEDDQEFVSLEEAMKCDVVSLHTPLTREGDHPTLHMIGHPELEALGANQLLINAGRGEVIDSSALLARLDQGNAPTVALDVWEQEPRIHPELVDRVWLATPHIAGYSLEGKVQGTEMIYQSLSQFLGLPVRKKAGQFLPEPALSKISFTSSADEEDAIRIALRACYDPRPDDARLRNAMTGSVEERGAAFDRLRRDYPVRRECSSLKIQLKGTSKSLQDSFRAIGFKLKI
ncbi:4-phosphoerythronate dehydrogenase [Marinobacter sp. DSM 26671]|jgi:erythronate-4-phosphate dehydrogenase|uniref:Erythronate-4-phosphate dehydrogenase n=1 Tax=Marinobacter adhaerens TaxID=1033846 RepID=A0A359BYE0_9GAMM|nr:MULTISPECIES: 4-phosphoerythronate dehydrogenase PdxB [unclassified Marinobacter]MCP4064015.1 4-phosphoerythronate dehydrogenase PdxB [Gammaproteobacteria bacterium]HAZ90289.1 4-phosphoerythronate dehydrogenase PdxB [Marinobacter adhaerens]MAK49589.1 4-phosphoerythronate dehydrogenase PdxB [Marinobacter sp.]MAM50697.1 4-phosphoerythronate dehydrogenase PdxB [Marinobacter sp.]MBI48544.1 4-phosphoerythronate dehydrogenase PdxB [Marinobacter sp.]|tara:strand:+ start:3044 stop:4195 length:1152 start_codon:yes stop_codon:yes gene_type:complete